MSMFSFVIGSLLLLSLMSLTVSSWLIPFSFHISRVCFPLRLKNAVESLSTPSPQSRPAITDVSKDIAG